MSPMSKLQSTLAACVLNLCVLFAMTATTKAALPPGYEDVLLCPPTYCLTRRHNIFPGYVGRSSSMHVCKSMNGEDDRRPTAWGTRVNEAESRLRTLLAQSYHRRSCRSFVLDARRMHPRWPHHRNPPMYRQARYPSQGHPRETRYSNKRYPRVPEPWQTASPKAFTGTVPDVYTSKNSYSMKPKRFEARNVDKMAYMKKLAMESKNTPQTQLDENNDKSEYHVGSPAQKDTPGAGEKMGSDGVGAVAAAAKPSQKKVGAKPSSTKTPKTKNDKKVGHGIPLNIVAWCAAGALVILFVGGVTYRQIQKRKDQEFVNIDSTNFISKRTKRRSVSQSGQIYESPHIINVV